MLYVTSRDPKEISFKFKFSSISPNPNLLQYIKSVKYIANPINKKTNLGYIKTGELFKKIDLQDKQIKKLFFITSRNSAELENMRQKKGS